MFGCTGAPQFGQYRVAGACVGWDIGGVVDAVGGGYGCCCCGWIFIEKKPIVANIQATKMSIKPTKIIVSMAPHQSKVPAVENEWSPDFSASKSKVFLRRVAARI